MNSKQELRYSIIIPLYNKADWVVRSLDSLKHQEYPVYEVIVVDDCSTDDSVRVVKDYAQQCPQLPIKLISSNKNQGPGGCRNVGMSASSGTHMLFLDADDTFAPALLKELNLVFGNGTCAPQCVIFGYDKQPADTTWLNQGNPTWLKPLNNAQFLLQPLMECFGTRQFFIRTSNVAASAVALKGMKFDTSRATFEGISFWFRVFQHCTRQNWNVVYLRKSLHSVYFLPDSEIQQTVSLSKSKVPEVFRLYADSKNKHEKEFCKRICTTWFWHELSRLSGRFGKALFFVRFAFVLPFLSRQYQKPQPKTHS